MQQNVRLRNIERAKKFVFSIRMEKLKLFFFSESVKVSTYKYKYIQSHFLRILCMFKNAQMHIEKNIAKNYLFYSLSQDHSYIYIEWIRTNKCAAEKSFSKPRRPIHFTLLAEK